MQKERPLRDQHQSYPQPPVPTPAADVEKKRPTEKDEPAKSPAHARETMQKVTEGPRRTGERA